MPLFSLTTGLVVATIALGNLLFGGSGGRGPDYAKPDPSESQARDRRNRQSSSTPSAGVSRATYSAPSTSSQTRASDEQWPTYPRTQSQGSTRPQSTTTCACGQVHWPNSTTPLLREYHPPQAPPKRAPAPYQHPSSTSEIPRTTYEPRVTSVSSTQAPPVRHAQQAPLRTPDRIQPAQTAPPLARAALSGHEVRAPAPPQPKTNYSTFGHLERVSEPAPLRAWNTNLPPPPPVPHQHPLPAGVSHVEPRPPNRAANYSFFDALEISARADDDWPILAAPRPVTTVLSEPESDSDSDSDSDLPALERVVHEAEAGTLTATALRDQARNERLKMEEARISVKTARQRRDHRAAWKYSDAVFTHREAMRALDAKAAEMAFKENNKGRKQGVIDLHGLYVSEAMSQVKLALESKSVAPRPDNTFRFITGQGRHSTGGAKIRPALQDFCTKKGLKHTLDSKNQGVVIVELAA